MRGIFKKILVMVMVSTLFFSQGQITGPAFAHAQENENLDENTGLNQDGTTAEGTQQEATTEVTNTSENSSEQNSEGEEGKESSTESTEGTSTESSQTSGAENSGSTVTNSEEGASTSEEAASNENVQSEETKSETDANVENQEAASDQESTDNQDTMASQENTDDSTVTDETTSDSDPAATPEADPTAETPTDETAVAPEEEPAPETADDLADEALAELNYPEFDYENTVNGYKIAVFAQAGIFPENTEIRISQVDAVSGQNIEKLIADQMDLEDKIVKVVSFDISFWYDGKEIEPDNGTVQVSIVPDKEFKDAAEEEAKKAAEAKAVEGEDGPITKNAGLNTNDEDVIKVFHINDSATVEEVDTDIESDKTINIEADSFSVYSIVVIRPVIAATLNDCIQLINNLNLPEIVLNDTFMGYFNEIDPQYRPSREKVLKVVLSSDINVGKITVDPSWSPLTITEGLEIASNKELHLAGVTLKKGDKDVLVMRSAGKNDSHKGYFNSNIRIYDGTFDGGGLNGGLIALARIDGLTFSNCTFQNWYIHAAELAGCTNVDFTGCVFKDYKGPRNEEGVESGREALSFDMTSNDSDFTGYPPADFLPVSNCTITGCSFTSMNRGLGSHHIKNGVDWNNIHVKSCTFTDIYDVAVKAIGWTNSSVEDCTFNSVTMAVDFKMDEKMLKKSSEYTENVNTNNAVQRCQINLSKNGGNQRYGIRLGGFDNSKGKVVAKKKYYLGGYTIADNEITGSSDAGIVMQYAKNITVTNNGITNCSNYGIWLEENSNVEVNGNRIDKVSGSGAIYVRGGSKNKILENTITGSGKKTDDIVVRDKASDITVKGNTITGGRQGIAVYNKVKKTSIENNSIKNAKQYGIQITQNSTVSKVIGNTITNSKNFGINVSDKATVSKTKDNKFVKVKKAHVNVSYNSKGKGIFIDDANITVKKGKKVTLKLFAGPDVSLDKLKITSGDTKIATVSGKKVTGVKTGKTVLTVKSGKLTAQVTIIVK